jgi:O-antigen/teichoic acid export membrane protein
MGQDPERQAKATFRVCQVIPLALIPACLAQAFLSEPLLDWMYPNKWKFANELIMILSLGLAVYPVSMVAEALMHAQSRFREYYRFMFLSIAIFVCFVAIGALYSGLIGAAFGVSIHYFLISPIIVVIALRGYYSWHSTMAEIYLKPVVIGISVFAFCIGLRHYMVIAGSPNFNSSIVVGLLAPLLFVVTAYTLLPSRIHGLIDVLRGKMVGQAA